MKVRSKNALAVRVACLLLCSAVIPNLTASAQGIKRRPDTAWSSDHTVLHMVWQDMSGDIGHVYYANKEGRAPGGPEKSMGLAGQNPTVLRISDPLIDSYGPLIDSYGPLIDSYGPQIFVDEDDVLHVAWIEERTSGKTLHYAHSSNGGSSWWSIEASQYTTQPLADQNLDSILARDLSGLDVGDDGGLLWENDDSQLILDPKPVVELARYDDGAMEARMEPDASDDGAIKKLVDISLDWLLTAQIMRIWV